MIKEMDPVIDSEWLGCKNEPVEDAQNVGNVSRSWLWREQGINPAHYPSNKNVLENIAEDILVQKPLQIRSCDLPGYPRSTFLMVFSPDGTKVASTHGNHNVYVSELASGKHVRILKGHPRTPWCIAFHPSHPLLIGSGCLGGQVRVWDIASGGSEVWNVLNETVIASIAFHPREQLLVVATFNELYFWDWSQPAPFTKVCTNNINEKVRYVAFDALGYKLITGISLWAGSGGPSNNSLLQQYPNVGPSNQSNNNNNNSRRDDSDDTSGGSRPPESPGTAQDLIVNSYQNLVQRYDSLVRNYQRLFMVRHRFTNTPPPLSMIDRGTDPMETDTSPTAGTSAWSRASRSSGQSDDANPTPSTSQAQDSIDSGDGESSSRLLNLDVLSFDSNPSRNQSSSSSQERTHFGSRSSAFQPLNGSERSFRTVDQNERTARLLPNPFSSSGAASSQRPPTNTARTSIFTSSRGAALGREFALRRRAAARITSAAPLRPATANSSTQMSPSAPSDAHSINESLDLIRDILRDSGTRLLNLITDMSLSTLAERRAPHPRLRLLAAWRRDLFSSSSDSDAERDAPRPEREAMRAEREALRAERDAPRSERDPPRAERRVFRLYNERNDDLPPRERASDRPPRERPAERLPRARDPLGFDVSPSSRRFRVRTQSDGPSRSRPADVQTRSSPADDQTRSSPVDDQSGTSPADGPSRSSPSDGPSRSSPADGGETSESTARPGPEFDPDRPSTSRDDLWTRGATVPPEEAYRKVKSGVTELQKHTAQLTNLWLRGNRTTMRELRVMWENLRRRILTLHRETGSQDVPSYYTRPLLDRCMMLTEMSDNITRTGRIPRSASRTFDPERPSAASRPPAANTNASASGDNDASNEATTDSRPPPAARSARARSSPNMRSFRRILQSNYRWRLDEELRRRRLAPRYTNRSRRDFARAVEISATRHEIRMRAMQVLSVMFNMMMMCLEERGLSQLIISMLRTLKRALALTCLIVMSNRNNGRPASTQAAAPQPVESLDVVRIQNVDHNIDVNVDGPDDVSSNNQAPTTSQADTSRPKKVQNDPKVKDSEKPSTSKSSGSSGINTTRPRETTSFQRASQRWSNRLAVQISAANRNNSMTANTRRDLYLECKRQKALHRTNPVAHPITKKRAMPPVSNYRIPSLRSLPNRNPRLRTPRIDTQSNEPVAGPSNAADNANPESPGNEALNDFEHRVNFIRIAHMQAVRLRNAARNRFRRLQTIRLYTPSSVREMFALQGGGRAGEEEAGGQLHAVLDNVALLQREPDAPPRPLLPHHPPRVHDYLQPIILAQNAMVVDDEGGEAGAARRVGMAGLLDAGIISEALPAPAHRVQAWDFTTGDTPHISDSTKNVVVQRCRIHNDASIDISKDGRLLVALLPVPRLRNTNHWLGVYSLEWSRLGQCLHTAVLEQSAVSVALSPTARHLAVGLGSRRFSTAPHTRNNVFALLYRLEPLESSSRTGLSPIKELEQNWEHGFTSLNCLRWAPQPGQGLVYANNTGQLIIMS